MELGIFAKVFAGTTPAAVLGAARGAGFAAVQYNMSCSGLDSLPAAIGQETADAVRAASVETGVAIAAVSATYNMIHPDAAQRERGRLGFQAIAGAARRMGTRLLTLCTGTCDPDDPWRHHRDNSTAGAWEELCREFRLLLPLAEEHDVLLGVEPELANVVYSAERARQLLDTLGSRRVRIVLDAANLFEVAEAERQRALVEDAVELLGDAIVLAHAKDRTADGGFAAAGRGVLDYPHYLRTLQKAGFGGSVIAHGLTGGEAPGVAAFLRQQLAMVEAS